MTPLDRRSVLRQLARAAALGAAGAAASACGGDSPPASMPAPTAKPVDTGSAPTFPSGAHTASGAVGNGPEPLPLPADLPFQVTSGPPDRPRVALTFHGQGDPRIADSLLGLLEAAGARGTVLAVGTWLDEQPRMARRVLAGGHELGNHTMHHGDISAMSADRTYAEITDCADRLQRLTGSIGRWFRPSQAKDCTPTVVAQARRAGYAHCLGYDLDSLDFTDPGAAAVGHTVLNGVRPGSVVSLHFGHPGTVAAMPAILDGLRTRGLRAVTMSELVT
ncbi:polysaccharide deacetylase family protein [Embleya sp. NPDC008237]|uniref:polysaccharide deacetylase family protein n=1 Tax=Embleya sp. NPDC008237 TaxID=3363978 RepID=UPI0036F0C9F8